ncbi:MAG: hypothetical protein IT204_13535 [Fimbriimonadaceae bacterium]|nr:hypothetical protein [Fimbriimonadaceae bacterium]
MAIDRRLPKPGPYEIAKQVYLDLFGKDVQSNPTVSYTWVADQWGHLGLGFVLTVVLWRSLDWLVARPAVGLGDGARPSGLLLKLACLLVVAAFAAKEWGDFQREKAKKAESAGQFEIDWPLLWWNIVVAWFYIVVGAIWAVLLLGSTRLSVAPTAIFLVLASLVMAYRWLQQKICFQQAGLPFLYRLSSFPSHLQLCSGGCVNGAVCTVRRFADPDQAGAVRQHLVLSGPRGSGRTSLACGIATEFAFKLGAARYLTAGKLLELAAGAARTMTAAQWLTSGQQEFDDGRILWQWDRVDLLVVDDVAHWPPPAELLQAVGQSAAQRVVWVVGEAEFNSPDAPNRPDEVTGIRLRQTSDTAAGGPVTAANAAVSEDGRDQP